VRFIHTQSRKRLALRKRGGTKNANKGAPAAENYYRRLGGALKVTPLAIKPQGRKTRAHVSEGTGLGNH